MQIELGKGLGKGGLSIESLKATGYEGIFVGIGKLLWSLYIIWNIQNNIYHISRGREESWKQHRVQSIFGELQWDIKTVSQYYTL